MCIAIVQLPGVRVTDERLFACYTNNEDGCGMAYIHEDKVIVFKTLEFAAFKEEYIRQFEAHPTSHFLLHFRIRTQGHINESNCHPFQVSDTMAFIHNGTIPKMPKCDQHSDTWYFNEEILKQLPEGWMYNTAIHKLIEPFISWSKIAVLNITNEVLILNESSGVWDQEDGNWYSNTTYKAPPFWSKKEKKSKHGNTSEWWVGTQRRRYHNKHLQAFDYENMMWRDIDAVGFYIHTLKEDDELYFKSSQSNYYALPAPKEVADGLVDCEICGQKYSPTGMALCAFETEKDIFYICATCQKELEDYITLGVITIVAE